MQPINSECIFPQSSTCSGRNTRKPHQMIIGTSRTTRRVQSFSSTQHFYGTLSPTESSLFKTTHSFAWLLSHIGLHSSMNLNTIFRYLSKLTPSLSFTVHNSFRNWAHIMTHRNSSQHQQVKKIVNNVSADLRWPSSSSRRKSAEMSLTLYLLLLRRISV